MSEPLLYTKLRGLIRANGPMSVADYMAHALGDPEHGYYVTRDPLGTAGDFITAPEVSQMFGEIVGAWLVDAWRRIGAPSPVNLVELGPGRGTLMADVVRVMRHVPDLSAAFSVHLVETSPVLKERQAETLKSAEIAPTWHASLHDVPPGPLLLVANELFDALPIRQFVRLDTWRERVVGLDEHERLVFGIGLGTLDEGPDAPPGSILEICPAATALIAKIAERIAADGGAALIVDYGYAESKPGETLQAVRGHSYADPLADPGEADLTAHVDFAALARAAEKAGAASHGPITQGDFLRALGLAQRAERLSAGANERTRRGVREAAARLAGPDEMGTLFKVLALTRPGIAPPPFTA